MAASDYITVSPDCNRFNLNQVNFLNHNFTGAVSSIKFINNFTDRPLTITFADGIRFVVRPRHRRVSDFPDTLRRTGLIIRKEYSIEEENIQEVYEYATDSRNNPDNSVELQELAKACGTYMENRRNHSGFHSSGRVEVILTFYIDFTEFDELYKQPIYIEPLDIVVQEVPLKNAAPHPKSTKQLRDEWRLAQERNPMPWSYGVDINDPTERFGPRYINIGGKVRCVVPTHDRTRREGITIYEVSINGRGNQKEDIFYPLSQAQEAGLYRTQEEALTLGNTKLALEEKIKKIEMANLELTAKNNQLAQELRTKELAVKAGVLEKETELLAMKQANQRLQHEFDALKIQKDKEKAIRDDRFDQLKSARDNSNQESKSAMDSLKWIPAVATAAFAIVTGIMKLASTTKSIVGLLSFV